MLELSEKKAAEEHDVFVENGGCGSLSVTLHPPALGELTADGIPLVYDEEELLSCGLVDGRENVHEVGVVIVCNVWEGLFYIINDFLLYRPHDSRSHFRTCGERSDIEIEHAILVEIRLKRAVLFNLQSAKQLARVARLVVVRAQHLRRHRLAESAAACHAAVAALGVESGVDERYELCLVDVFVSDDVSEITVAFIDVCTHSIVSVSGVVCLHLAANIQRIYECTKDLCFFMGILLFLKDSCIFLGIPDHRAISVRMRTVWSVQQWP